MWWAWACAGPAGVTGGGGSTCPIRGSGGCPSPQAVRSSHTRGSQTPQGEDSVLGEEKTRLLQGLRQPGGDTRVLGGKDQVITGVKTTWGGEASVLEEENRLFQG